MEWEVFAPMAVMITAIVTTGAVLVIRPLSKRLGDLIEAMVEERRRAPAYSGSEDTRALLATLDARLSLIEERQDFAEALLGKEHRGRARPSLEARIPGA